MMMTGGWHPSRSIRGSYARYLSGRCIVVGITGSVAAYRSLDTARWLLRRGARVVFAATKPALEFLGEKLLYWATGERPITELGGEVEHISFARMCDGMIVAPSTLSTAAKIAYGVADNVVVTLAVSFIGLGKPVLLVPAMHENMTRTPQYRNTVKLLESEGVVVVPPRVEEETAKYPDPHLIGRIAAALVGRGRDLLGRKVVVTAGPTREWLDPVRFISNPSSGKMGVEVAVEAWARGASVTLVHGWMTVQPPHITNNVFAGSTLEMRKALEEAVSDGADIVVASAAPVDFKPSSRLESKMRSGEHIMLELEPTVKVIEGVKEKARVLAAFAAETVSSREELLKSGMEKMEKYDADIVVANRVGVPWAGFASDILDALLIWKSGERVRVEDMFGLKKEVIAQRILDTAALILRGG